MTRLGTPLSPTATKVLFLGAGELGKEVIIELQRLGVEVIACDRYENAPGMQVAHRAHVFDMTDAAALRAIIAFGKFHGVIAAVTPIGSLRTRSLLSVPCVGTISP